MIEEDWQHNVHEDHKIFLFRDLEYLIQRVDGKKRVNFLAILQNPTIAACHQFTDQRFDFCGFDLVERGGAISALLNCGGFNKVFSSADLSVRGLVMDCSRAVAIQLLLRAEYPADPHADCDVWAIWRLKQA